MNIERLTDCASNFFRLSDFSLRDLNTSLISAKRISKEKLIIYFDSLQNGLFTKKCGFAFTTNKKVVATYL